MSARSPHENKRALLFGGHRREWPSNGAGGRSHATDMDRHTSARGVGVNIGLTWKLGQRGASFLVTYACAALVNLCQSHEALRLSVISVPQCSSFG